jgi:hypothetical protein
MRVANYTKGMKQAQENADLTGDTWYLFSDTSGNYRIEDRMPTQLPALVLQPRSVDAEWWLIPTQDKQWIVVCKLGMCCLGRRDDAVNTALEWFKLGAFHFKASVQKCGVIHFKRQFMRKGE